LSKGIPAYSFFPFFVETEDFTSLQKIMWEKWNGPGYALIISIQPGFGPFDGAPVISFRLRSKTGIHVLQKPGR
jgi:hypothetical protein